MSKVTYQTKNFPVTGMTCANCAAGIERHLKTLDGVINASVNLAANSASIEYNADTITPEELKASVQNLGYDLITGDNAEEQAEEHRKKQMRLWQIKLAVAWFLSAAVMFIPMLLPAFTGEGTDPVKILLMFLTIPVMLISGGKFYINAWKQAKHRSANMDTLVALSTIIAFIFSVFTTFDPGFWISRGIEPVVYYEAAAMIISFVLTGKYLEERAKFNTAGAIRKLMGLRPKTALVEREGRELNIPVGQIVVGEIVIVRPGEKIAADGVVTDGNSFVDESMITGEPVAVEKWKGEKVCAGTINTTGSFRFRASKVGSHTLLAEIIEMVKKAQGSKAPVQKTADKIAAIFVPIIIIISILTFITWIVAGGTGEITRALLAAVSVLVIACPCALGLATPTALMVGIGNAASNHILIKDATALEQMRSIDTVVLDKTGTVTEGKPLVKEIIWTAEGDAPRKGSDLQYGILLRLEKMSEHPLAGAITAKINELKPKMFLPPFEVKDFRSLTGEGIEGYVNGKRYWAASSAYADRMAGEEVAVRKNLSEMISTAADGSTIVVFGCESEPLAVISISDTVKPGSAGAIRELEKRGIEVHLLTGDNESAAAATARETGITHIKASVKPSEKEQYIRDLRASGRHVAMAGDGINDSQALAAADVSIAMAKGSDIAIGVAMVTLVKSDLMLLPKAFDVSARTVRLIKQNLFWAFIYNLIGIPIAAGVLYPLFGFMLDPMMAAAAMAFSSVSVVLNSLRAGRRK
jgi:Cu2+-exporting ATPase